MLFQVLMHVQVQGRTCMWCPIYAIHAAHCEGKRKKKITCVLCHMAYLHHRPLGLLTDIERVAGSPQLQELYMTRG